MKDQPAWPSVDEQLAQSGVIRGSALEALIRENQDFHLLHPYEMDDKVGIPPWLRVYWRKHNRQYVWVADRSAGYPRVLKTVHAWMIKHQDLKPGLRNAAPEPARHVDFVSVGSNLRISGSASDPRSESDIRINFHNPMQVLAGSNDVVGQQAQFFSSDGGRTWGQTSLPLWSPKLLRPIGSGDGTSSGGDTFQSDPSVDWTSDGTAWASTIGVQVFPNQNWLQLRVYRSTDGGRTWAFDATPSSSPSSTQIAADKETIWVDHSSTSPYRDTVYLVWHNSAPVFISRKTGPAGAWQLPMQISGPETTGVGIGGDVKTNANGDVFVFWPDTGSGGIFVSKSTDGGATFMRPVRIATTLARYDIGIPADDTRRALIYVSGAAHRTATKDLVFVTWVDLSGASGCGTPADEPGSASGSACKTRIWFSRSVDGGVSWETPRMICNQVLLNDQFNQRLALDESTGNLAVIYYDTIEDPARLKADVWFQSSTDDGATWSVPSKVTTAETDETTGGADPYNQYGDYNGLSACAGQFLASWTDRRSGGREEIWASSITGIDSWPVLNVLVSVEGKLTMLRVHDVGTGYGPRSDYLDVEVVVSIDSQPGKAFGFQLRADQNAIDRARMLDVLRDVFNRDRSVTLTYIVTGPNNGVLMRVIENP